MKFSIVTPTFNMQKWIEKTIESVLLQSGDFEIEYIIVDGNSKDNTVAIINKYIENLKSGSIKVLCKGVSLKCIQQIGTGMYSAINQGFKTATGDIYAWINGDDIYEPYAFEAMHKIFQTKKEVLWVKGITSLIDEQGKKILNGGSHIYIRKLIELGIYGREAYYIEQDSVFWKKELWNKICSIPEDLKVAGDYWLWTKFAQYADLFSLNVPVSCFRKRLGQLSKDISLYKKEQKQIIPKRNTIARMNRLFFSLESRAKKINPHLESIFRWLYPVFWPSVKQKVYFELNNGNIIEKKAKTYKV